MTGLDKITQKIAEESRQKVDAILADAHRAATQILADGRADADEKANRIIADANAEADRITSAAKAKAESITRTKYLEVKNAVVNDVIAAAFETVEKMDDASYFDLLYKLCVKNIEKGECEMFLNARDLARLPADFEDRINSAVYETGAVHVAQQPKPIEHGFVLVYGDMEVNCTLRAVFDASMDMLKDLLGPMLFA